MEFCQYEYTVSRKPEGIFALMKLLLVLFYIAFAVAYFVVIYIIGIIPLGALIPVALWILVFFTWRYVKQDYKYEISGSHITFSVIYGNKKPKSRCEIQINTAKAIIPLDASAEEIAAHAPKRIYSAIPKKNCEDAYAILYTDEAGRNCVFKFKATAEALHLLHLYNSNTIIRKTAV